MRCAALVLGAPIVLLKPLLIIYAVIGCFSVLSFTLPALRKPERAPVRHAINSWWPPTLIGGAAVMGGPRVAALIFAGVGAWALVEQLRLTAARYPGANLYGYAATAVIIHYAAITLHGASASPAPLLLWCGALAPLLIALRRGAGAGADAAPRLTHGGILCCWALGYVPMLCAAEVPGAPAGGAGVAMLLMICVMTNDAAQYVCGKLLGRRPLIPSISPKKTWEGLIGGALITAAIAALVAPTISPWSRPVGAAIGVGLALLGLLGDLLISVLKREAGVKDSGAVLPGQGGVLDRADSLLISAPISFHMVTLWSSHTTPP